MKQFFKYVLATIVGFFCVGIFMSIIGLVMLGSMMVADSQKPSLKEGSVLHIALSGNINERANDNPFRSLMGNSTLESQGLDDILKAIKVAKNNSQISGIYLEGGAMSTDYATLQELRKALVDFKQSKKFILAYADTYTQGSYYLSSVADKVLINPSGMIDWRGIASQPIFFTDLLKKVGVKMQVFKVGTYKSAVEPFILTGMSDANREQLQSCISDIWSGICQDVSASRHIPTSNLNALADGYITFSQPENYVKSHLVDSLSYIDGVRSKLRQLSKQEQVNLVTPSELAKLDEPSSSSDNIAVYYAQGDIVDEVSTTSLTSGEQQIVGSRVVDDLDKLANDDNVKAVVIRVNSGGGSAYASEQMWRAVQLLKKKKPVVVSMSGMAASGGYYLSCGADYIVAEPTTLTGSIGIFGMIPDASGLLTEKLGLHFDVVKTNKASDFGAMGRAFNADEAAAMQGYVNRGYLQFITRVADGRHMTTAQVDRIGQGRVWTGSQALKLKLVDKLGTLNDAIAVAASRAKLKDYAVTSYPDKESWMSQILNSTTKDDYMEQKLRMALGEYYAPLRFVTSLRSYDAKNCVQARMYYWPNVK